MLATNNLNKLMYYNVTDYVTSINMQSASAAQYNTTGCVPNFVFTPGKKLRAYTFMNFTMSFP